MIMEERAGERRRIGGRSAPLPNPPHEPGGWGERTREPFRRLAPAREYARPTGLVQGFKARSIVSENSLPARASRGEGEAGAQVGAYFNASAAVPGAGALPFGSCIAPAKAEAGGRGRETNGRTDRRGRPVAMELETDAARSRSVQ